MNKSFLLTIALVLQCGAVCRSVVQCGAVCCSVVQCVAVCCSVLQNDALIRTQRSSLYNVHACVCVCGCVCVCVCACMRRKCAMTVEFCVCCLLVIHSGDIRFVTGMREERKREERRKEKARRSEREKN